MNAKAIVVTSGKGGVGKTTTTANVGAALAKLGEKVVVIDTDVGLRNLDVVMGLEGRVVYDLIDVFEGRCKLKQALIRDKRVENLHLLAASQTRDKSALSEERMKETVTALIEEEGFDRILIDSPAGIESGFQTAASAATISSAGTTSSTRPLAWASAGLRRWPWSRTSVSAVCRPSMRTVRITPPPPGSRPRVTSGRPIS